MTEWRSGPPRRPAESGERVEVPGALVENAERRPRVLVVAHGFPPFSDPTSHRWLRFAGGLARNGWDVEVLTARPTPRFEYFDPALVGRIPPAVRVHRAHPGVYQPRIWKARLQRATAAPGSGGKTGGAGPPPAPSPRSLLRWVDDRLHAFKVPDPSFEWIVPGILLGLRVLAGRRFDLLVSSAAPFSSHVVAHSLQRWSRLPWIADFSDPFSTNPFVTRPPWRRRLDRALEDDWFRSLAGAIVPVPEMKTMFLRERPGLDPGSIHVIPYGFERELYERATARRFEGFTIVHTGTFYPRLRDPEPFLDALAMTRDLPWRVVHAGVMQADWMERLARLGITERFEVLGLLSREAIAPLQLGASCLLLIGNRGGLQLPGKVLDYLGARRPILALRNDAHDIAADLVAAHGAAHIVPNEPEAIAAGLRQVHAWWADGSLDSRFRHGGAPEFAWQNLEDLLDEALRQSVPGAGVPRHAPAVRPWG